MCSAQSSINDRQKWNATHNPRSISRGHCGHGGAAVFSSCRCAVTSLKLGRGLRAPGPFRPHSIPGKPLSQSIAYLDRIHLNRLSSLTSFVGFDANGKDLTIGTRSLPPEGKTHD